MEYLKGHGSFVDKNTLKVTNSEGKEETINSDNFVIATGSEPNSLKGFEIDEKNFVSSTGALSLEEVPKELIVIGAGVIGLEMGSVYGRMGSKVTFVEYFDKIAPFLDNQIGKEFTRYLKKQKYKMKFN